MTPMRHSRMLILCLLLSAVLGGCATTSGPRFGASTNAASGAGTKSMAVVGDRTMPTVSGEPGSQVAAELPDPEPRKNPKARISGRVVDEQGKSVVGATVRLADGGTKAGRDVRATTDRAGGFTLNGLRPGSTYSLIAELDDEQSVLTGRTSAKTAETGVEITLASAEETNPPRTRATSRSTKARSISNREVTTGPSPDDAVNLEDLPPARDADEPPLESDSTADRPSRSTRPRLSAPVPSVGWKKGGTATSAHPNDPDSDAVADSSTDQPRTRSRVAKPVSPSDEEDATSNPLPPAIDRSSTEESDDREPQAKAPPRKKVSARTQAEPGELALASITTETPAGPQTGGPAPMPALDNSPPQVAANPPPERPIGESPPESLLGTLVSQGDLKSTPSSELPDLTALAASPPPTPAGPQITKQYDPAPEPVFASTPIPKEAPPAPAPAPALPSTADYNPFVLATSGVVQEPVPVPAPRIVAAPRVVEAEPAPPTEPEIRSLPPRKKWADVASTEPSPPAVAAEPLPRATSALVKRLRGQSGPESRDPAIALCSYDARLRRIVDFRLPDLDGQLVRFQDLDADYILLDFWGSWCAPCFEAIPHLIELQKQYGPSKLKIVGIACEQAPVEARKAKVEAASKKLGINYTVLISGMDGKPCPVQESLQIQTYPTTILVDRQGRILWRNSGATPTNQMRLDRVLAALGKGDTTVRR